MVLLLTLWLAAAPEPARGACDYERVDVDPKAWASYLKQLQAAVDKPDLDEVVVLARLPLAVNVPGADGGVSRQQVGEAELRASFAKIFTPRVVLAVRNATVKKTFCNSKGLMIGDGELWFSERSKPKKGEPRFEILAVNPR